MVSAFGEEAARKTYGSFADLQPDDIADAVVYAVKAPWRVNVYP